MPGLQAALGVLFVLIGCMHFALRDREPESRSIYFGGLRFASGTRTALAVSEVVVGAVLILTT